MRAPSDSSTDVDAAAIPEIVGTSPAMRQVCALVRAAAASEITVLVEGETGTGKELVARALADLGTRRERPFVAINCGALAESMLDAELFGHRHGAFTGAVGNRRGLLEAAQGGTLFLDEITSMSAAFQAKLLRVLENAEIRAVGSERVQRVDLRVVAASNQPLAASVAAGRFRADLFYRLRVFPIVLPPLRARREDVPLLIERFLAARCGGRAAAAAVAPAALQCLLRYHYPGNVRELRNEIARAAILAADGRIEVAHLSEHVRGAAGSMVEGHARDAGREGDADGLDRRRRHALAEIDRRLIHEAIERHGYNLTRAAAALRLSRFGLRKRMHRLGVRVRRSVDVPLESDSTLREAG
jgi:two-component system response regulator HupR/HoxA